MFKTSDYRTRHKHWPSLPDPREVRDGVVQRQHVANEQANQTAFGTAFAWLSCQRDLPPSQGQCVPALLGARGTVKLLRSAAVKRHSCCEGCCICFSLFGFSFNWRLFNCMGTKQKKKTHLSSFLFKERLPLWAKLYSTASSGRSEMRWKAGFEDAASPEVSVLGKFSIQCMKGKGSQGLKFSLNYFCCRHESGRWRLAERFEQQRKH